MSGDVTGDVTGDVSGDVTGDVTGDVLNGGAVTPGAVKAAEEFVTAIVWGDHRLVWELLSLDGRATVLGVASARGMDEGQAARLREGNASESETTEFLTDLVNGLRADLAGNDLDHLVYEPGPPSAEPGRAAVVMLVPLYPPLGGTLPVGTVELVTEVGAWKVERMVPLTSK